MSTCSCHMFMCTILAFLFLSHQFWQRDQSIQPNQGETPSCSAPPPALLKRVMGNIPHEKGVSRLQRASDPHDTRRAQALSCQQRSCRPAGRSFRHLAEPRPEPLSTTTTMGHGLWPDGVLVDWRMRGLLVEWVVQDV